VATATGATASLTGASLLDAVTGLAARDSDLAGIVERFGPPPMWGRPAGFATLAFIILEQQVSLASARAAFDRLTAATGVVTPETFLRLDDRELRAIGFSRQKAAYVRALARAVLDGEIDLEGLGSMADHDARSALLALSGVGPWTADVYLLLVLGRPDVWPATDLALVSAVQHVKRLTARPTTDEMERLAEPWRPWRAVAARLFWHDYLSRRGQRDDGVPGP
jgi:DNA-3-methyladenine glycosylase II